MEILFNNVSCGYGRDDILTDVNLLFRTGEFWCILGANGIGKTTLIKSLLGFIQINDGEILIDGISLKEINYKNIAHNISYVPQAKNYSLQYTVLDTVLMGRAAHIRRFSSPSARDYSIAIEKMNMLGIEALSNCMYSRLSGGEQQVVLIARALAQESRFIIMDEPASNLDFENQKRILDIMKALTSNGVGIIMSSHEPEHAFYCDADVVLIKKDKSILQGKADCIINEENLKGGYGVDVGILRGTDSLGRSVKACVLKK